MSGNPLFHNSEFQRTQRAKVKSESLSASGKAGYQALVKKGKGKLASRKAAEWRLAHPSNLEQTVIDWLDELKISYRREVEINGFYADFVCRNFAIEVMGAQWHEKYELRPEQKERDSKKYQALTKAGYTVIILPERDIKSGEAKETLTRLIGDDLDF